MDLKKLLLNETPIEQNTMYKYVSGGTFTLRGDVYFEAVITGGSELKLFKGAKFIKKDNQLYSKTYYGKSDTFGNQEGKNKQGEVFYNCKTGKIYVKDDLTPQNKQREYYNDKVSTGSKNFQLETHRAFTTLCKLKVNSGGDGNKPKPDSQKIKDNAIKCGWKNQDGSADVNGYKGSGWECPKPGVPKPKPNVQRPNVQNVVKQIQQNLNQEQTGQFTTKDIQDIIIKLGGKAESPVMTEEINRIRMIMNLVVEQVDLDSIIKQNVKSEVVTQLQELLKTKYSEDIIVDGYFGPKTANALLNSLSKIPTNVNQTNTTQPDTTQPERLQTVSAVDAAKGLKPTGTLRGT